MMHSHFYLDSA